MKSMHLNYNNYELREIDTINVFLSNEMFMKSVQMYWIPLMVQLTQPRDSAKEPEVTSRSDTMRLLHIKLVQWAPTTVPS